MAYRGTGLRRGAMILVVLALLAGGLPACMVQGASHHTQTVTPDGAGEWGWATEWYYFNFCDVALVLLASAAVVVFAFGIRAGRYAWTPLVLGLFALGFGLLSTTIMMIDTNLIVACHQGAGLRDFAEGTSKALVRVFCGLMAVMLGGLLTWILHARAARLKRVKTAPPPQ